MPMLPTAPPMAGPLPGGPPPMMGPPGMGALPPPGVGMAPGATGAMPGPATLLGAMLQGIGPMLEARRAQVLAEVDAGEQDLIAQLVGSLGQEPGLGAEAMVGPAPTGLGVEPPMGLGGPEEPVY